MQNYAYLFPLAPIVIAMITGAMLTPPRIRSWHLPVLVLFAAWLFATAVSVGYMRKILELSDADAFAYIIITSFLALFVGAWIRHFLGFFVTWFLMTAGVAVVVFFGYAAITAAFTNEARGFWDAVSITTANSAPYASAYLLVFAVAGFVVAITWRRA
ncbi:MAG: hypothetical protein HYS26_02155 [Candidatus Kaiserbacteria bacterium]|nr:MAG: hypothetical protein HYS26_02155 [Candidatus Kaiserbacteria bacterium]